MNTKEEHIHMYVKWQIRLAGGKREHKEWAGEKAYKCDNPDCTHTAPYSLVIGKRSLCTVCNQPFILTKKAMELTSPRCLQCSNSKEGRALRASQEVIGELLTTIGGARDGTDS